MATSLPALDPELFLPEPEPRPVRNTIISVDDHLVEPPDMFEGRLPAHLQERAPKVVTTKQGHEVWEFDGERHSQVGMNAVAGRRPETVQVEPFRFDQMRPGCWDVDARIRDMDLNGVWASLSFPSMITGFCGRVYSQCSDPELGLAVTRAWNDWMHDAWWSPHKDRIIPMGITWLSDPELGAAEIRRNADRGFRTVTLPERPHLIGYPSIFTDYWEPILRACADTDTVVSLHVGSSGMGDLVPGSEHVVMPLMATLFGQLSLTACTEWLWSGHTVRIPGLKVSMAEGGIGWVAMLLDRLDNIVDRSGYGLGWKERPADVLRRDFWFCTIDDPSTIDTRHAIGVDHIMVEVDYPHGDSTWPDTQAVIDAAWGHLPAAERRAMCCENAARLFRHPLPAEVLPA
ncbi:MAG TPA: amidohydrolase family protein [Acidimicrobiales bacterium]|nr:amidohydrolase family protein [Acidimicrobiales bacterium]